MLFILSAAMMLLIRSTEDVIYFSVSDMIFLGLPDPFATSNSTASLVLLVLSPICMLYRSRQ